MSQAEIITLMMRIKRPLTIREIAKELGADIHATQTNIWNMRKWKILGYKTREEEPRKPKEYWLL